MKAHMAMPAFALVLLGCPAREQPEGPITIANVGFQTPESVLHDAQADVYLVSNINGSPLAKDDNGFISRVAPDGSVLALKWVDGVGAAVTLHAPKGMALTGDTLFVADIDAVRLFDRATGAPLGTREIPGATFINDIALGPDGVVYFTDSGFEADEAGGFAESGSDAVYRFAPDGSAVALARDPALGRPNGIVVDGGRIIVVAFGAGTVAALDLETGELSALSTPAAGQLDGIVQVGPETYLISSWEGQAVYRLGPDGRYETVAAGVEAPADIGYDATRNRLLIPLFTQNRVEIRPLGG